MISLPVWVFEPTSFLQIMAEPFQFEDLLRQAATAEVTYERLQYLVAWNVALYSQASRISTPFVSYPQRNLLIHFLVLAIKAPAIPWPFSAGELNEC